MTTRRPGPPQESVPAGDGPVERAIGLHPAARGVCLAPPAISPPPGAPLELEPDIADEAAWSDSLTAYDLDHLAVYLRLLDAERDGADWREVARIVLGRSPDQDEVSALKCWETHMARARWMTQTGYRELAGRS